MDKANLNELIKFILESLKLINSRFKTINSSDDFLKDDDGLMRLDAISMRLQAIGEALKNIDKRDREFLLKIASETYWSNIIKTEDLLIQFVKEELRDKKKFIVDSFNIKSVDKI